MFALRRAASPELYLMGSQTPPLICIPVCVHTADQLNAALDDAAAAGDIVEIRLDCLQPEALGTVVPQLSDRLRSLGKSSIVTLRSSEEGGVNSHTRDVRRRFWLEQAPADASFFDIELDLVEELSSHNAAIDWDRVICSHHDFRALPDDLIQTYERMARTRARILKIAVQVDDIIDNLPLFALLNRASVERREIIAIAMGQAGIMSRILGPSRGDFLTYGAMEAASATAPGQLTARELREVYRLHSITEATEIVGLVGKPTEHSMSPQLHNAAFAASQIDAVYLPFEVSDVAAFISRMVNPRTKEFEWNLRGLSVTAPHKSAVIRYLDHIDPAAEQIGAVNTIVLKDGWLHGYNTDAEGFIKPLLDRVGSVSRFRCAVIGSGGAARTACWALKKRNAGVTVLARNSKHAEALAGEFGVEWKVLAEGPLTGFDLVVNATPVGTRGSAENESVASADQLRGVGLVYDLVYNPRETRLVSEAMKAGCDTLGGLEMLVAQAKIQFRLWTGLEVPNRVMEEAAKRALV